MRAVLIAGAVIAMLGSTAGAARGQVARKATADCAAVQSLKLPDVAVTSAEAVATPTAPSRVKVAHCKVRGVIGTEIGFEVLLPDSWNGRFAMGGGGGFAGSLDNQFVDVVNAGYATASTDTGHQADGLQAGWALHNLERQVNYGYLGVHRTAEVAKAVIRAYYGADSAFSYFLGCSNGGRQALMEAQRFPRDFDGIVSGAPALDFVNIAASFVVHAAATFPQPSNLKASTISPADLKLVASAALDACDGADGVKDGVVDQPGACRFSLDRVKACPGEAAGPDCLTATARKAVARIYAPITGPSGEIYPGQPVGGEADAGGWQAWITGVDPRLSAGSAGRVPSLRYGFGTEFFKYFVYGNPSWDYTTFDITKWQADTAQARTVLNADNDDLSGLKARKGKLILWHGWSDPALNAHSTINYFDRVRKRDPAAADYARLFLMPGVLHCRGGAGPDSVDWMAAIAAWTEKGIAPERITATKRGPDGAIVRSRPLCPYPQHAVYSGTGSQDDAANFVCK
jgi:feruloyl esterase